MNNFNINLYLTEEAKRDLSWWIFLTRDSMMVSPLLTPVPDIIIKSDASNTGWGVCQGEIRTGGIWSRKESLNHINYLELLAAFLALRCFSKQKGNIAVLLKMDNLMAVTYVYKQNGGDPLTNLVQPSHVTMGLESAAENIHDCRVPLQRKENTVTDQESRVIRDRCD